MRATVLVGAARDTLDLVLRGHSSTVVNAFDALEGIIHLQRYLGGGLRALLRS